jgi:NAD(P)-dependent dehydrogenase (short-subunit alcohol dehydrogenase family)
MIRRVLVTGGNKGIGKGICEKILNDYPDTFVFLCSRSKERGEEAVANIAEQYNASSRIELLVMDVSDDASVTNVANFLRDKFEGESRPLFGIVNNAALGFGQNARHLLNTNYYGCRRVNEAFMPLLQDSGRVVHMSSASGPMFVEGLTAEQQAPYVNPNITPDDIEAAIDDALSNGVTDAYGLSKACLNMYNTFLARTNPGLVVAACTPGFIDTDMTTGMGATGTIADGCRSPLFCLMGNGSEVLSGAFYGSDSKRSPLDRYRAPGSTPYDPPSSSSL